MTSESIQSIPVGDREIFLLGTAHVSSESVREVEEAVRALRPDCVCVELDKGRLEALSDPDAWKKLDLIAIIRKGQLSTLVANLMLASHQKRMGLQTGVKPGSELVAAVRVSQELGIPVVLVDREIKTTLGRAWALTPWRRRFLLAGSLLEGLFDRTPLDEQKLAEMREQDTLTALMDEMGKTFPEIRQVVIVERDHFMTGRILASEGKKVLAVVGAGHRSGMADLLSGGKTPLPEAELVRIPPPSRIWALVGWSIPALIVASFAWVGYHKGVGAMGDNVLYWILVTGLPAAFGTLCALGHPLAILTGFLMAPLTTLHPLLGVGTFTALVQAWFLPPRVHEMESVSEDLGSVRKWWSNRLLRIFLCFLLPGLPTTIGMLFGVSHIFKGLVP